MSKQETKQETVLRDIYRFGEGGKFFGVTYTKKDGSTRRMNARLGVEYERRTDSRGMGWDPVERGLLPVFDVQKEGFRMVNLRTASEVRGGGQVRTY